MSELPVQKLYIIEGSGGPAKERVKQAMDWLLSLAAEGIGEELLRKAYARHGKPITIFVTRGPNIFYTNVENQHILGVNPNFVGKLKFFTKDKQVFHPSLEVMMAHELTHATQDLKPEDFALIGRIDAEVQDDLSKMPEAKALNDYAQYAQNTPYRVLTQLYSKKLAEGELNILLARQDKGKSHPDMRKWAQKFEIETVENENKVAKLRGEPQRATYTDTLLSFDPEEIAKKVALELGIEGKLGIPPLAHPATINPDFWQRAVKNPEKLTLGKWEPNAHEHPLIATHQEGGRTD